MWPRISRIAETAIAAPASSWAGRSPPIRRASRPVSSTTAPAARAEGSRQPTSALPKSSLTTRASNGVKAGWST